MKFLKTPITSEKVEKMGQVSYKISKWLMFIGVAGLVTLLTIILITAMIGFGHWIGSMLMFHVDEAYLFVTPFLALSYLAIAGGIVGVGLFFFGVYTYTLGRIAVNTEKEDKE